jgi:hypothetical protein
MTPEEFALSNACIEQFLSYLDDRRLLGTSRVTRAELRGVRSNRKCFRASHTIILLQRRKFVGI